MKKLFTLFIAMLTSISVMFAAERKVPAQTLELPTSGLVDPWGGTFTSDNNYFLNDTAHYIIYYPYAVRNSNQTTWSQTDGGGSNEIKDGYAATGIFKGFTYYNAVDNGGKKRCDQIKKDKASITTYRVTNCTGVSAYIKLNKKGDKVVMNCYEMTDSIPAATATKTTNYTDASSASTGILDITGLDANKEYLVEVFNEGSGSSAFFYEIAFYFPAPKQIISTSETLINAKVNGEALAPNFLSELIDTKSVEVLNAYATAPTVTFTKHVVITYEDESIKESDVDIEVVAEELGSNQWTADITIGENTYMITMQRATAYTVTYKEGEQVLGTELVAANGNPAEFAKYEKKPLATFDGWFKDAELTQKVESMAAEVISADVTFYADFDKAYAQSIDFEQMVLNQGVKYDVKSALTANFYDYKNIDALDSLNNEKGAGRNEPYLGLKIKKQGGYLACNVLPGTTIRIKFGYVGDKVLAIAGGDTLPLNPTNNKIANLSFPIAVETSVKLQTTSDKTVVIKQIMIDEPLVTWMYPITYAAAENGEVSGWTVAYPGEEVVMNITANEGYTLTSLTYNGTEMVQPAPGAPISFTMPAEAVTVAASFGDIATGIGNADAAVKAVKVIRDGKLFIEKNGVLYNAQGVIVK